MSREILSDNDLDLIFRTARSYNGYQDKPVTEVQIRAIYDLLKMGPTSANCQPARFIFCMSQNAKDRLADCAGGTNPEKIRKAPAAVVIGTDMEFYEKLPQLFPHAPDAKNWFKGRNAEAMAFRNSTLQGAYFIIAARAIGLDTGPMSGFDNAKVDEAFFADTTIKSNFISTFGYGDTSTILPRLPRLSFEEAAQIL